MLTGGARRKALCYVSYTKQADLINLISYVDKGGRLTGLIFPK